MSILKLLEEYDKALEGLEEEAIERLHRAMDITFRQLTDKLTKTYPKIAKVPSLLPAQRELLLTQELGDLLSLINPAEEEYYQGRLKELINGSHDLGQDTVEKLIREIDPDFKVGSFTKLPQAAAAIAADNSYKRLARYGEVFKAQATQVITQGLIQGWGNKRIAQALKQATNTTKSNAEMIARTESAHAAIGAAQRRYQDTGIKYGIWVSVLTEVCPWCVSRSGKIFELREIVIPAHPRCRCGIIPVTPEWARSDRLDFGAIDKFSARVKSKLKGSPRSDKAPFEIKAPQEITIEQLKKK